MPSPALRRMTSSSATLLQLLPDAGGLSPFPLTGTNAKSQEVAGKDRHSISCSLSELWSPHARCSQPQTNQTHAAPRTRRLAISSPPGLQMGPEEVATDNNQAMIRRRDDDIKATPQ